MSSSAIKLAAVTIVLAIGVAVVLDKVAPFEGEKIPPVDYVVDEEKVFSKRIPDDMVPGDVDDGGVAAQSSPSGACATQATPEAMQAESEDGTDPAEVEGVVAQGYPTGEAPPTTAAPSFDNSEDSGAFGAEDSSENSAATSLDDASANEVPADAADVAEAVAAEEDNSPGVPAQGHPATDESDAAASSGPGSAGAATEAVEAPAASSPDDVAPSKASTETATAPADPVAAAAPTPAPRKAPPPPAPRAAKPNPRPSDAELVAWWPEPEAGKLNLRFAGEAAFTQAIVLLFDGSFDQADSINEHVVVKTREGRRVRGQWMVNVQNDRMALFNSGPGTFKVSVSNGIEAGDGRTLSTDSEGLVYVK